jgi:hypothetical protein
MRNRNLSKRQPKCRRPYDSLSVDDLTEMVQFAIIKSRVYGLTTVANSTD